ncbi:hypothetical protein AAFC00_003375 [Neodothiora populina]|uniref:GDP/GTP exchange factor Sec2 N-terminal domain-containing protein n=1 Tax=Neodothiora populina TaxID=2781224 RepID=A0ABR3PE83_9PEZI
MSEVIESEAREDSPSPNHSIVLCSACHSNPEDAQRIQNLEEEVRMLRDKATAAADKLADYEEEIRLLRGHRNDSPMDNAPLHLADGRPDLSRMASAPEHEVSPQRASFTRFSFLTSKKALPLPPSRPISREGFAEMEAALARETHLRVEAEKKASTVENEIEELSATLFEQANEMVSTERREKAQLVARVRQLEDDLSRIQSKDGERSRRLERIEEAMKRIDRVKSLLHP